MNEKLLTCAHKLTACMCILLQKVSEMWKIVTYMTQLPPQALGDVLEGRNSEAGKTKLICQAQKYLENRCVNLSAPLKT